MVAISLQARTRAVWISATASARSFSGRIAAQVGHVGDPGLRGEVGHLCRGTPGQPGQALEVVLEPLH